MTLEEPSEEAKDQAATACSSPPKAADEPKPIAEAGWQNRRLPHAQKRQPPAECPSEPSSFRRRRKRKRNRWSCPEDSLKWTWGALPFGSM